LAYHEISIMDIWEVIRRWHDRHTISQIARALDFDRKTVRTYIHQAQRLGWSPELPLPGKDEVLRLLQQDRQAPPRVFAAQSVLTPFLDEIVALIRDEHLALTLKSAFEVLCQHHDLRGKVSYSSFKRFVRKHALSFHPDRLTCRIEVVPGSEVQIDYARVAMLTDPASGKRRRLYAFIGTLSYSRLKYVELTFSQDQMSFVSSHIRMFEFFGGVPLRVVLDNLKSGVIRPDLYDPQFNRTYREMSEHYHTFLDPARVRHPKDKGKVERDVRTVRDAVRKLIVLNPTSPVAELNRLIKRWSTDEYGQHLHGTTREKPSSAFTERERPALLALPTERFELAEWKQATVHPDHYVQFKGKAYSIPHAYVGKTLWIRASEHLLQAFYQERLVKQHAITRAYRHTDSTDFPANSQIVLDTGIHRRLLDRAQAIGADFYRLIHNLLSLQAYVNLRKAQGLLTLAEASHRHLAERAACFMIEHNIRATPRDFRLLLEKLSAQCAEQPSLPFSEDSREFIRDITYFIKEQEHPL
jgi:transposase